MKKYLVEYSVRGIVFQRYMSEVELGEVRYYGKVVSFRQLLATEIMKISG